MTQTPLNPSAPAQPGKWPLSKVPIVLLCLLFPLWGAVVIWLIVRKSPEAARFTIRAGAICTVITVMTVMLSMGWLLSSMREGDGEAQVFAPRGESLTVSVDGGAARQVPEGTAVTIPLAHGKHTVTMTGKAGPRALKVNVKDGFYHAVLPYTGQCFVIVDVSDYQHSWLATPAELPQRITDIRKIDGASGLFEPGTRYTAFDQLPKHDREKHKLKLLRPVECAALAKPSEEIVRAAFAAEIAGH